MSWREYEQAHHEGIEQTEEEISRWWAALLLLLFQSERRIVSALRPHVLGLPTLATGRFATASKGRSLPPVRRFRARAQAAASRENRTLLTQVVGRGAARPQPKLPGADPTNRNGSTGLLMQGLDAVADQHRLTWQKAQEIAEDDRKKLPDPPKDPSPQDEIFPGVTFAEVEEAREKAQAEKEAASAGGGEAEDIYDIAADGKRNPQRHITQMTQRIPEEIVRVTGRFGRPQDVLDMLERDGGPF